MAKKAIKRGKKLSGKKVNQKVRPLVHIVSSRSTPDQEGCRPKDRSPLILEARCRLSAPKSDYYSRGQITRSSPTSYLWCIVWNAGRTVQ